MKKFLNACQQFILPEASPFKLNCIVFALSLQSAQNIEKVQNILKSV